MFGKVRNKITAIKLRVKTWHEKRLIMKLQKCGWLPDGHLDIRNKKIHLGWYGMCYSLMDPKEKFLVHMLVKRHGWQAMEERVKIINIE